MEQRLAIGFLCVVLVNFVVGNTQQLEKDDREQKVEGKSAGFEQRQFVPIPPNLQQRCDLCCDGVKFNGLFGPDVQCCGKTYYYLLSGRCCPTPSGPVVVNYPQNATLQERPFFQCCGSKFFNYTTQMCCGTTIRERVSGRICCGNILINPATTMCCNGRASPHNNTALQCCGTTAYDPRKTLCLPDNSTRDSPAGVLRPQLCGDVIIDMTRQICCNGVVNNRPNGFTACCNNVTLDSRSRVCCNGTVRLYVNGSRCCGTRFYQPSSQVCCNGTPRNVEGGDGQTCSNIPVSFPLPSPPQCCGTSLMNPLNPYSKCCNNTRLYTFTNFADYFQNQCCGSRIYNLTSHACCSDQIYSQVNIYSDSCCGSTLFSRTTHICCAGSLYPAGRVPLNKCCCTDQTTCGALLPLSG